MMCHTSFSLFQIKTKLIHHVFLTILHKFSQCCFMIPFSVLNSEELDSFWYPWSAVSSEKYTHFANLDVGDVICQKSTLFYIFCVRGCIASHVESDSPVLNSHDYKFSAKFRWNNVFILIENNIGFAKSLKYRQWPKYSIGLRCVKQTFFQIKLNIALTAEIDWTSVRW